MSEPDDATGDAVLGLIDGRDRLRRTLAFRIAGARIEDVEAAVAMLAD